MERMEMYMAAGLSIETVVLQAGKGLAQKKRASLDRVRMRIEGGQPLASALAEDMGYPPVVLGIISCGESSGNLAAALKCSHSLLEREDELSKKCISALTYPCIIGLAAFALMIGLVRGIMPQILPLLSGLHTDLPFLTKAVMRASSFFLAYGAMCGAGALVFGICIAVAYERSLPIQGIVQSSLLRIPLLGILVKKYALSAFFQSLGALAESGMRVDSAYEKSVSAVALIPLRKSLLKGTEGIRTGSSFRSILPGDIPDYVAPLVSAGEASGNLAGSFLKAAAILDKELDHSLKRLTALIEPVMMIGMGFSVGAIALSIMMPIYDISKTLQH